MDTPIVLATFFTVWAICLVVVGVLIWTSVRRRSIARHRAEDAVARAEAVIREARLRIRDEEHRNRRYR